MRAYSQLRKHGSRNTDIAHHHFNPAASHTALHYQRQGPTEDYFNSVGGIKSEHKPRTRGLTPSHSKQSNFLLASDSSSYSIQIGDSIGSCMRKVKMLQTLTSTYKKDPLFGESISRVLSEIEQEMHYFTTSSTQSN